MIFLYGKTISLLMQSNVFSLKIPEYKKVTGVVGPNCTVDHLKARLVTKGFTQIFGHNYGDAFSPIAKMTSIGCFYPWQP